MTRFEEIGKMSVDELANFFADSTKFLYSPCYVCQYDEGLNCVSPVICTNEYKAKLYKEWLNKDV